jgi:predicted RNase H-like HicB family nuclease
MSVRVPDRIVLERAEDGGWVATDERTAIADQGPTREAALENLDEAIEQTAIAVRDDEEVAASVPDAPWFDE